MPNFYSLALFLQGFPAFCLLGALREFWLLGLLAGTWTRAALGASRSDVEQLQNVALQWCRFRQLSELRPARRQFDAVS